jgi:hypothetical protein
MIEVTSRPLPMPAELIAPLLLELLVLIEVVVVIGIYLGGELKTGRAERSPEHPVIGSAVPNLRRTRPDGRVTVCVFSSAAA